MESCVFSVSLFSDASCVNRGNDWAVISSLRWADMSCGRPVKRMASSNKVCENAWNESPSPNDANISPMMGKRCGKYAVLPYAALMAPRCSCFQRPWPDSCHCCGGRFFNVDAPPLTGTLSRSSGCPCAPLIEVRLRWRCATLCNAFCHAEFHPVCGEEIKSFNHSRQRAVEGRYGAKAGVIVANVRPFCRG